MRAKARRLQRQQGQLDLIVIDYLQLMTASSAGAGGRRYENRTQEVSAISRGLKALAKELRVPVVALSQLSRASETRGGDKKPMLSDLRESGSIEQDADVVAFIHRDSYYNKDENGEPDPDSANKAEIIIANSAMAPQGPCIWLTSPSARALKIWPSVPLRRVLGPCSPGPCGQKSRVPGYSPTTKSCASRQVPRRI